MHLFGTLGSLMFLLGLIAIAWMGIYKLIRLANGVLIERITLDPYFYLALTLMILGTQLFLAGFLGELISRSAPERNCYLIDKRVNINNKDCY